MALIRNETNILGDESSQLSSPEEEIIRSRGRKETKDVLRVPQSPTTLATRKSPRKASDSVTKDISKYFLRSPVGKLTPVKSGRCIQTSVTPTRSSPRKRLNLSGNDSGIESTPNSGITSGRKPKRLRLGKSKESETELHQLLRPLSQSQLVDLVVEVVQKHPEISKTVSSLAPKPDITPMEETLSHLKSNIYKALPMSKYGSGRDAFCFRRVKTHLDEFKKAFLEQGKNLMKYQDWETCIRYNIMAFKFIDELPTWDNDAHNDIKKSCFNALTTHISSAIKKGKFENDFVNQVLEELQKLIEAKRSTGYDDKFETCIKTIRETMSNKQVTN